ncbi:MAG: hypothetical protein WAM62_09445, partial [Pseudolabrys sp.]
MRKRHHVFWEILRPSWRWGVLVPLAILGSLATIRDDLVDPAKPELYRLAHWLPAWPWYVWGFIFAVVFVFLILESAYRAINWRENLIEEMAAPEETLALLTKLHAEGGNHYRDTG